MSPWTMVFLVSSLSCSGAPPLDSNALQDTGCIAEPTDANANGRPDACERTLLASLRTPLSSLYNPSEHVRAWLAYDTDGAMSTWVELQPGLEARVEDRGPFTVEVSTLVGWDAVEARLVNTRDEPLTTRVVQLDFERTHLWTWSESELGILGELGDDDIHALGMEVIHWDIDSGQEALSVAWYFFGAQDVL